MEPTLIAPDKSAMDRTPFTVHLDKPRVERESLAYWILRAALKHIEELGLEVRICGSASLTLDTPAIRFLVIPGNISFVKLKDLGRELHVQPRLIKDDRDDRDGSGRVLMFTPAGDNEDRTTDL